MIGTFEARLPASAGRDVELFVFGDLHGRSDLLAGLLDAAAGVPRVAARREVVFLGDLIDRGHDPLGVVALTMATGRSLGADALVVLEGNHDGMLATCLDEGAHPAVREMALRTMIKNGGRRTIDQAIEAHPGLDVEEACRAAYGGWLAGLRVHHRSGGIMMVHAGLNPGIPLEEFLSTPSAAPYQGWNYDEERHWAWVRAPFLEHRPKGKGGHHGWFVVHGHSIRGGGDERASDAEAIARWRLNLDAGSFRTGKARMAVIRGDVAVVHEVSLGMPGEEPVEPPSTQVRRG